MKYLIIILLPFYLLLSISQLFAESETQTSVILTIKGIDSNTHNELSGDTEWTFVNRETDHVIRVQGSNEGTDVTVMKGRSESLNKPNSIYYGKWLVAGLSEPYSGLSTLVINKNIDQEVEVNLILKKVEVEVNAPNEVTAGTIEKISWKLPETIDGKFTLQKVDEKPFFYAYPSRLFSKVYKDSIYDLKIPAIAGDYLLRFYSLKNTNKAIFEKPVKVLPAKITLNSPSEAIAGTEIDLSWDAPETSQAKINLKFSHNKPDFNASFHVRTIDKKEATLLLPSTPGNYVLRWFSSYDRQLMFEKPIKILAQKVVIKAPSKANAGKKIDVSWDAPERSDGLLFIIPAEEKNKKPDEIIYTKGKSHSALNMPDKPGKYLIRFLNASDYFIVAEHSIELLPSN